MKKEEADLLRGTLELLILRLLRARQLNGWEMMQQLQIVSGDAQRGVAGEELAVPLVVSVSDAGGNVPPKRALNFEVVSAEKPWHTREAKSAGASGLVQVEVLIDPNGKVIQATARTGNKLLHAEAERAALASTFNRPTFGGKPARAIGFLVYRFGPEED